MMDPMMLPHGASRLLTMMAQYLEQYERAPREMERANPGVYARCVSDCQTILRDPRCVTVVADVVRAHRPLIEILEGLAFEKLCTHDRARWFPQLDALMQRLQAASRPR